MSGEVSVDRRLSPSGRFITDSRTGNRLPVGSGTPGLIWRGQLDGAASPVDIAGGVPILLPGQGGSWALQLGYRYDVECFTTLRGSGAPTVGDFIVVVEASSDGGATWPTTLLNIDLPSVALGINESRCFTFGASLAGGGPLAADITDIRTRSCRVGAAGNATIRNDSWTKIVQYVGPADGSAPQVLPFRLSPSGAEILDATSQQPLEAGDGTPGLVWRGQYTGADTNLGANFATPVVLPGMGGAWALPTGYFYDIEFSVSLQAGVGVTINDLVILVEGSTDNGATWTVGLGVFVWNNTGLLASEAASYSNGTIRFPLNVDVTNVRLRAGADGNATDRIAFGGFLRVEQYTEGDDPEVIRLSPSGTFLEDATTNAPAQFGSGTPGLIFRGVLPAGAPVDVGGVVPQLMFSNAWAMPSGYHYDIEAFAEIADAAAGADGDLNFVIEGSTDNGGSWFAVHNILVPTTSLAAGEGREYFAGLVDYTPIVGGLPVDLTNLRLSIAGGVAGRRVVNAWMKVMQYVQ